MLPPCLQTAMQQMQHLREAREDQGAARAVQGINKGLPRAATGHRANTGAGGSAGLSAGKDQEMSWLLLDTAGVPWRCPLRAALSKTHPESSKQLPGLGSAAVGRNHCTSAGLIQPSLELQPPALHIIMLSGHESRGQISSLDLGLLVFKSVAFGVFT